MEKTRGAASMKSRLKMVAALAMIAVLAGACSSGSDEESGPAQPVELEPANPAAGCGPVTRFGAEESKHVEEGAKVQYKTQPPTTGNHERIVGATGTIAKEIPDEVQVHNLEHGHVLIQYVPGRVPAEVLSGLVLLARANKEWVLLAPRSASRFVPEAAVAFTAWRTLQACDKPVAATVDEAKSFVKRYQGKAPEKIGGRPVSENPPNAVG